MKTLVAAVSLSTLLLASAALADSADDIKYSDSGAPAPVARAAAEDVKPVPLSIGDVAPSPNVEMANIDGTTRTIKRSLGERGTLIIFTCNGCPYVGKWQDRLVAVAHSAMDKSIGVIAINSNDPSKSSQDTLEGMKKLAKDEGYRFPYVVDEGSKVARAFGALRTPEVFLLDTRGTLVYHGAIDDNVEDAAGVKRHYLAEAIASLVEGNGVAKAETKSIGCSIKFYPQS